MTLSGILHPHSFSRISVALASPTSAASLAHALARHPVACFTTGRQSGLQQAAAMAFDDILKKDTALDKQLAEILRR